MDFFFCNSSSSSACLHSPRLFAFNFFLMTSTIVFHHQPYPYYKYTVMTYLKANILHFGCMDALLLLGFGCLFLSPSMMIFCHSLVGDICTYVMGCEAKKLMFYRRAIHQHNCEWWLLSLSCSWCLSNGSEKLLEVSGKLSHHLRGDLFLNSYCLKCDEPKSNVL